MIIDSADKSHIFSQIVSVVVVNKDIEILVDEDEKCVVYILIYYIYNVCI